MRFNGEVRREMDGKFEVKISIADVPSMTQAEEIGKFLHQAVQEFFHAKGATFKKASPLLTVS